MDALEKRITDAQDAAKADIEAKAQKAYEEAVTKAMLEVELAVTAEYRKEIEAKEAELEQAVSF